MSYILIFYNCLDLVDASSLVLELEKLVEGLVERHQLTLALGGLVVTVANVDGARFLLFRADDCTQISI